MEEVDAPSRVGVEEVDAPSRVGVEEVDALTRRRASGFGKVE
jgi:hypothetical protein